MKAKTERLILRELVLTDAPDIFEMDSDPKVHLYLGNKPITTLQQAEDGIRYINKQYSENGIGRWAVVEKTTGECIGWCGLKFFSDMEANGFTDIHEIGYRFKKKHWGKGYATEAAKASLNYGFDNMKLDVIYGMTHADNLESQNVFRKLGLNYINDFELDKEPHKWFEIRK